LFFQAVLPDHQLVAARAVVPCARKPNGTLVTNRWTRPAGSRTSSGCPYPLGCPGCTFSRLFQPINGEIELRRSSLRNLGSDVLPRLPH
jgi:hypothetical protein